MCGDPSANEVPPRTHGAELAGFGRRVRSLREDAGLSQSKLARRSGIDRPSLHRLKAGRLDVRVTTAGAGLLRLPHYGDVAQLDAGGDLVACETLP